MAQYKITGWSDIAMAKNKVLQKGEWFSEIEFPMVVEGDYQLDNDEESGISSHPIVSITGPRDIWSLWWFNYEPIAE